MNTRLTAPWGGTSRTGGTAGRAGGAVVSGRRRVARSVAVLAALCTAVVVLPGAAAQAEDEPGKGSGQPAAYEVASDAKAVKGTASSTDAPELPDTGYYTDSIGRGETKYYRVDLDDKSSAYLSALAHPKVGGKVGDFDKLEVQLESTDGTTCSSDDASFQGGTTAYPIVAFAARRVGEDSAKCLAADQYLFKVVRDDEPTSDPGDWPLELRYALEPGLNGSLPAPPVDGTWSTEPPTPPTGEAREVEGGAGLSTARPVSEGVWRDTVLPGETRYYRVPVDFGQQLFARAELPNAPKGGDPADMSFDAFALHAYTPSGAAVVYDNFQQYDGSQSAASLGLRPVEYGNRFDSKGKAISTAGFYTLAVTVTPDLQRHFPAGVKVTLRVKLRGEAKEAPDYVEDAKAAGFAVTDQDRKAAEQGLTSAEEASGSSALKLVGIAGLGAGVALVLGLGLWTLLARRRAAGAPGAGGPGGPAGPGTPGGPGAPGGSMPGGPMPNAGPPPGSWQQ